MLHHDHEALCELSAMICYAAVRCCFFCVQAVDHWEKSSVSEEEEEEESVLDPMTNTALLLATLDGTV